MTEPAGRGIAYRTLQPYIGVHMQYIIGSMTSGFLVMHDRVDATLHGGVQRLEIFFFSATGRGATRRTALDSVL